MGSGAVLGSLFVHTQCLKVDTVTMKFNKILLNLKKFSECGEKSILMRAEVGGCFGKTEEKSDISQLRISFDPDGFES